jgi:formylglycine-generating enzyme required for sulfatase activity
MWKMLHEDSASDAARLRLACLAAHISPADDSWRIIAPAVCSELVRQHPIDMATFTALLWPARQQLFPALVNHLQSKGLNPSERRSAVSIATRFVTNEVDSLVALTIDSQPDEFALLFPALEAQRDATLPPLKAAARVITIEELLKIHPTGEPREIERDFDRAIRKGATAAIAAWRLGDRDIVRRALKGDDPSLRAWLIELLMPLGVTSGALLDELRATSDAHCRQALVLALGQARDESMAASEIAAIRGSIAPLLRSDPNAGVHAACRWLLKRMGASDDLTQLELERSFGYSPDRSWFYATNKHLYSTMVIPADFRAGSPATELWREVDEVPGKESPPADYTIAVSAYETTVEQFHKFRTGFVNHSYSATPDCPANNIPWYDAAGYCRWLSEQEGIAEDQMVFPPVDQIGPDMKLPKNWLARTGYRLATDREFEFACRAGTTTSRYCGAGRELLPSHAWHLNCSDDHAWPVGTLKPNALGLSDMLGNVAERCIRVQGLPQLTDFGQSNGDAIGADQEMFPIGNQGLAIGGDFGDLSQNVRAARRTGVPATAQWGTIGFRVVRTMPKP